MIVNTDDGLGVIAQRKTETEKMMGRFQRGDQGPYGDTTYEPPGGGSTSSDIPPGSMPPEGGGGATGGGGGGTSSVIAGAISRYRPEPKCLLKSWKLSKRIDVGFGEFHPDNDRWNTYVKALTSSQQQELAVAILSWRTFALQYPNNIINEPWLVAWHTKDPTHSQKQPDGSYKQSEPTYTYWLGLHRPTGGDDPMLYKMPPILPPNPMADAFSTALAIFFPDHMFTNGYWDKGSATLGGKLGTRSPHGPFPYWAKMVSKEMVDFAYNYLQTTPDAFAGAYTVRKKEFSQAGNLLRATGTGLSIGMSAGPIGGVVAGVASAIIGVLSSLFGGAGEVPTPEWLKKLLPIAQIRARNGGDYYQKQEGVTGSGMGVLGTKCPIAWIRERGDYTIFEAYEVLMKMLGGDAGANSKFPWIALAIAAGAIAFGG